MRNLKILFIKVMICILGAVTVAQAQTLDGKKFGFCDLSKIFDEYEMTKENDTVLQEQHNKYEDQRNGMVEKLRESQGKLSLLKDDEKVKLEAEIEKMRADALEFDRQMRTDLKKHRDEKIQEILLRIEKVVNDYAEQEKFSVILNDRVLIYGDKQYDITEPIIKKLNEEYLKNRKEGQPKEEPKKEAQEAPK